MTELDDLEDKFARDIYNEAYESAYEQGRRNGQEEGKKEGAQLGARFGSEIGYYRGYTKTWIEFMKLEQKQTNTSNNQEEQKSKKILNKLEEVLQLVESFPHTNETQCEEKLSDIRIKFKNLKHYNIIDDDDYYQPN